MQFMENQLQTMKIVNERVTLLWQRGGELHLSILIVFSITITTVGNWAVFVLCWVISACIIGAIEAPTQVNTWIVSLKFLPLLYVHIYIFMGYGYVKIVKLTKQYAYCCIAESFVTLLCPGR